MMHKGRPGDSRRTRGIMRLRRAQALTGRRACMAGQRRHKKFTARYPKPPIRSHSGQTSLIMVHINLSDGVLGPALQTLDPYALLGIFAALLLGGMVKGVVSIGVPLVAMPILSHFLPIRQAVLLL